MRDALYSPAAVRRVGTCPNLKQAQTLNSKCPCSKWDFPSVVCRHTDLLLLDYPLQAPAQEAETCWPQFPGSRGPIPGRYCSPAWTTCLESQSHVSLHLFFLLNPKCICVRKSEYIFFLTFVLQMRVRHQFVHDQVHVFHISWAKIISSGFILDKHCRGRQFRRLVVLICISPCLPDAFSCMLSHLCEGSTRLHRRHQKSRCCHGLQREWRASTFQLSEETCQQNLLLLYMSFAST